MNLDWRQVINDAAPVTSEERLADAIRAGDQYRRPTIELTLTPDEIASFTVTVEFEEIIDSFPKPSPHPVPAQVQPLARWRRWLIALLGGQP